MSVEYRNGPCDYIIKIGVPNELADVTGSTSVSGSITYQDQNDQYRYVAPVSGRYRFDSDLSAGGSVKIRISGENGNSLSSSTNALTINLEAGKTYILSVEYRDVPCDYTVNIGVPIAVTDITEEGYISGCIRYRDQTDRYLYTAPDTGTYRFSTDLDAGGKVKVRIGGENGNSIKYAINDLSVNLEEGKTYMLSVEYENGPCFYEVFIEEDYE